MNFGMIIFNKSIKTMQNYVTSGSFLIHIKAEDYYKDIAHDVKKLFDTSNYSKDDERRRSRRMNKVRKIRLKDFNKICCS